MPAQAFSLLNIIFLNLTIKNIGDGEIYLQRKVVFNIYKRILPYLKITIAILDIRVHQTVDFTFYQSGILMAYMIYILK